MRILYVLAIAKVVFKVIVDEISEKFSTLDAYNHVLGNKSNPFQLVLLLRVFGKDSK